jgi:hypothetical protein
MEHFKACDHTVTQVIVVAAAQPPVQDVVEVFAFRLLTTTRHLLSVATGALNNGQHSVVLGVVSQQTVPLPH